MILDDPFPLEIFDVSMPIHEGMPVYKNQVERCPVFETIRGYHQGALETRLRLDAHTGTHFDASQHMLPGGGTVDNIPLSKIVTPCRVLDLTDLTIAIKASDLEAKEIKKNDFILMKTKNSSIEKYQPDFVFLSAEGARFLSSFPVKGVGIDALGVERDNPKHPAHIALFKAGAVILEGLRLGKVPEGRYLMVAAPLPLIGTEAAPARVLLLKPIP